MGGGLHFVSIKWCNQMTGTMTPLEPTPTPPKQFYTYNQNWLPSVSWHYTRNHIKMSYTCDVRKYTGRKWTCKQNRLWLWIQFSRPHSQRSHNYNIRRKLCNKDPHKHRWAERDSFCMFFLHLFIPPHSHFSLLHFVFTQCSHTFTTWFIIASNHPVHILSFSAKKKRDPSSSPFPCTPFMPF